MLGRIAFFVTKVYKKQVRELISTGLELTAFTAKTDV